MSRKKKNIVLEKITVEDYAAEGKSLAKVEGKVIFIEGVVPGDVVDVKLGRNKKDWAEGRPLRFHSLSPDRVEPFCSHFGVCGGCQWHMFPYEKQLLYKQKQVRDNLQRIGGERPRGEGQAKGQTQDQRFLHVFPPVGCRVEPGVAPATSGCGNR